MGSMYKYIRTYKLIVNIIYNCYMISFTISLEVKGRVGAQFNKASSEWHEIQRRNTASWKLMAPKWVACLRKY